MPDDDPSCPLCGSNLSSNDYKQVIAKLEKETEAKHKQVAQDVAAQHEIDLEDVRIKTKEELSKKQNEELDQTKTELNDTSALLASAKLDLKKKESEIELKAKQFEEFKKKQDQKPAWLQGQIGEMSLLKILNEEFPDDKFETEKPGVEEADIVQRIYDGSKFLDTTICYDNKESKRISPADITKAKNYKNIHNTNHVIVVTTSLPAKTNQAIAYKDDVLIVHPFVIGEVAGLLRQSILKIANVAKSEVDRNKKETQLYEYVMSETYVNQIGLIYTAQKSLTMLQDKEENEHKKMWKKRKEAVSQLVKSLQQMEANIRDITQQDFLRKIS